ncbi:winged helix-turn-helix domain-containing protein [Erythrobacter sp.]|uniref:winged helix-turn-helix domain-containing protein n=1 Tax=Erythrobacter sp. TaxID=1042 RepID=UPI0025FCE8E1|nr:winged helix-turn-helix domain-containing protein [Erythrobacter sp.]
MKERLVFDQIELDATERRVSKCGKAVKLSDLGFDLLWHLACRAPEPVANQELAEAVWKQSTVSDETVAQRIAIIRRALDDDADDPKFVRTVRGRGYAFAARPVQDIEKGDLPAANRSNRSVGKWVAAFTLAVLVLLALAAALVWSNRPEILVDPENGALRLDNVSRPLSSPATALVDGRPVLVAGLAEWSAIRSNPSALEVICKLRRDRSQFTNDVDPELLKYLNDPAKAADCN